MPALPPAARAPSPADKVYPSQTGDGVFPPRGGPLDRPRRAPRLAAPPQPPSPGRAPGSRSKALPAPSRTAAPSPLPGGKRPGPLPGPGAWELAPGSIPGGGGIFGGRGPRRAGLVPPDSDGPRGPLFPFPAAVFPGPWREPGGHFPRGPLLAPRPGARRLATTRGGRQSFFSSATPPGEWARSPRPAERGAWRGGRLPASPPPRATRGPRGPSKLGRPGPGPRPLHQGFPPTPPGPLRHTAPSPGPRPRGTPKPAPFNLAQRLPTPKGGPWLAGGSGLGAAGEESRRGAPAGWAPQSTAGFGRPRGGSPNAARRWGPSGPPGPWGAL